MQRAAFAVRRVADSVEYAQRDLPARRDEDMTGGIVLPGVPRSTPSTSPVAVAARPAPDGIAEGRGTAAADDTDPSSPGREQSDSGLLLTTRQAVQVGVAHEPRDRRRRAARPGPLVLGGIAAFVVFAGTHSRGDVLSRGWGRLVGTAGGLVAGMGARRSSAGTSWSRSSCCSPACSSRSTWCGSPRR